MSVAFFMIAQGLLLLAVLGYVLWFYMRSRRQEQWQNTLVSDAVNQGLLWHRVVLVKPENQRRWWRLLPYDCRGVLTDSGSHVSLMAIDSNGERLERVWSRRELAFRWYGNHLFAGGNLFWLQLIADSQAWLVAADTGLQALNSRQASADLLRYLDGENRLPPEALSEFDLFSNPASRWWLIFMAIGAAYSLTDGLLINPFEALDWGYCLWGVPVLIAVVTTGGMGWLKRRRVPVRESIVLAILAGTVMGVSWLPLVKRLDAALAGPASLYDYRLEEKGILSPVTEGMPEIRFGNRKEYWQQFEAGSIHPFRFVHGPLGIWQLDHRELAPKMREFYNQRP